MRILAIALPLLVGASVAASCALDLPERTAAANYECSEEDGVESCSCIAGWADCDGDLGLADGMATNGCEMNIRVGRAGEAASLTTDAATVEKDAFPHCGACGQSCNYGICRDGVCQPYTVGSLDDDETSRCASVVAYGGKVFFHSRDRIAYVSEDKPQEATVMLDVDDRCSPASPTSPTSPTSIRSIAVVEFNGQGFIVWADELGYGQMRTDGGECLFSAYFDPPGTEGVRDAGCISVIPTADGLGQRLLFSARNQATDNPAAIAYTVEQFGGDATPVDFSDMLSEPFEIALGRAAIGNTQLIASVLGNGDSVFVVAAAEVDGAGRKVVMNFRGTEAPRLRASDSHIYFSGVPASGVMAEAGKTGGIWRIASVQDMPELLFPTYAPVDFAIRGDDIVVLTGHGNVERHKLPEAGSPAAFEVLASQQPHHLGAITLADEAAYWVSPYINEVRAVALPFVDL